MNTQNELFHEDWRDALRHLVKALGGYETVGGDLFPNKTRKAAGNWLSDCLNSERPAKLDLEDITGLLKLGRKAGDHTAMRFLTEDAGYQNPQPSTPKSPKTLLLERQAKLTSALLDNQREIDRVEAAEMLRAVK